MATRRENSRVKPLQAKAGTPRIMDGGDARTFDEWMQAVDRLCWYRGVSVYDLPDCPYMVWYARRLRPIWAANRALRRAGAFAE